MKLVTTTFVIVLMWITPRVVVSAVEREGDRVILSGASYSVAFSATNGSILSLSQAKETGSILRSGEWGYGVRVIKTGR